MGAIQKLRMIPILFLSGCILVFFACEPESTLYEMDDTLSIEIVQPLDGDIVEGTIEIRAVLGAKVNIQKMAILIDGQELAETNIAEWKTTYYLDGVHEIRGLIIDAEGNEIYSEPVSVVLKNSLEINQNGIKVSNFNGGWGIYWSLNRTLPSHHTSWDNSTFLRFISHDSFISQRLNVHFEKQQQYQLSIWVKTYNHIENVRGTLSLAYSFVDGRRQNFVMDVEAKPDWKKYEFIIDSPFEAGEFVEVRVDAAENFCLDDVILKRIK